MGGSADTTSDGGSQPENPRAGDVLGGRYRVDREIGVGGMGIVLAATHVDLGEPVAIKLLLPPKARREHAIERFMREARAAARIKSEHIVRVSDVGRLPDGTPYLVMERLVGRDLGAVLADDGRLAIPTAIEYVLQAATGIAEAHALGIVHRDLKPANLFLTRRADGAPFVKVLDFGISKTTDDEHVSALTTTTETFGSPAYMSPEQIRSARNVDARTDVWALGVILHELLTGRTPFKAETVGGLLSAIAADPPEPLRVVLPDASAELEAAIARCLEKQPERRFASMSELAAALDPFRAADSIVSVGRIRRLSGGSRSAAAPPAADSSRAAIASTMFAATDGPVTTSTRSTRVRPWMAVGAGIALVGAAAATVVGMGGGAGAGAGAAAGVGAGTGTGPEASGSANASANASASARPIASANAVDDAGTRAAAGGTAKGPRGGKAATPPRASAGSERTHDPTAESH